MAFCLLILTNLLCAIKLFRRENIGQKYMFYNLLILQYSDLRYASKLMKGNVNEKLFEFEE